MSVKAVAQELYSILSNDLTLAFVKASNAGGIHLGNDITKLIEGKHPWINIEINPDTLKIEDAANIRAYDVVRNVYKLDITMSVSNKDKNISVFGRDEVKVNGVVTVSYIPGVLDLNELVWTVITNNPTLNDTVDGLYNDMSLETDVLAPYGDGILYKAGARMSIIYYKDECKR